MNEKSWTFSVGGLHFDGTVCSMVALTCLVVFAFVYFCSRNMQLRPKGKQNVLEYVVDFTNKIIKDNLSSKEVSSFGLLSFVLFLFILVSNIVGLMTIVVSGHTTYWKSPTADPSITLTLALMVILMTTYVSIKRFGFKGYFKKSYLTPMPAMLPISIFEEFTNVLTLGLRLYGNIFAGEVLLSLLVQFAMINKITPFIGIVFEMVWQGFSVFIGAIQAFIFVTLTMVYLSHKIEDE